MYKPEINYEEFLKREQEKNPELNLKDIEVLKSRLDANVDLTPISRKLIILFLHSTGFDVDVTYNKIVNYCKYQKELPQVFSKFDPSTEEMKKVFETITICELTDLCSSKEPRVIYTCIKNPDPQLYDYVQATRYFFMMMDYLLSTNGTFDGLVVVMNGKNLSWRHVVKTPINTVKKIMGFIQEALPVRLKEVHILNAGSMAIMLYNISKPFMKKNLIDILKIHSEGSTDIFNNIPIEILPVEEGGKGKPQDEYSEKMFNRMLSERNCFLTLN